jgi:benzylsuccinate CoA-transferase BbsE subunit/naphthyl-2-methylsuccinate CoA transferase subunit
MKEEGVEEWQEFDDDKWIDPAFRSSKEGYNTFCRIFERYSSKHEKMYLYEKGQSFRVAITPVSNGKDLLENPQLRDRNFWQTLRHDNLNGEVTYPGAPYEFNNLRWRLGRPAPHFGQHTREILTELGYSNEKIDTLSKEEVVYVG